MSQSRFSFVVALASLSLAFSGCDCSGKTTSVNPCEGVAKGQPGKTNTCESSSECAEHYSCNTLKGQGVSCCVFADRKCNTEADCCPGQACTERKVCFDKILDCENDTDCGDKGDLFCDTYTDTYGSSKRCRHKPCSALGECPEGQACFQGECVADLPCGGACEAGKACVPSTNRCQDYASPSGREEAACPMSCSQGFLATFKDNRNIWDSCTLSAVDCVCAELPPLLSSDLGRFSAMAPDVTKNQLWVSSYDGQFGDLVVFRFDAEGKLTHTDYVDGVPAGTPRYGPSGPRGGIVEPGQDVGRHTDIAVNGQNTYVSYYDATQGNLKIATKSQDKEWTTVTLDGTQGDVGLYSSIAVDSDGFPGIAYFQRGGASNFDASTCPQGAPSGDKGYITALKFAKATKALPTQASDFVIKTLACQSRPIPPCTGCTQTCADPGTGPSCYASATSCSACDANTEVCVTVGGTARCAKKYNPSKLQDVSDGVGLFTAVTFDGKKAKIVYMRREAGKGSLYGVTVEGSNLAGTPVVLDDTGDTGWFPDVKFDATSKKVLVSYHDFSSRQLKFLSNADFAPGLTSQIIDSGAGTPGSGESNWVGADSALIASSGKLYAVYQDATRGDLKLAARNGNTWAVLSPVRTTGAVGFFADGALLNGKLFFSHAQLKAKSFGGEPKVANSLLLDKVTAP